MPEKKTLVRACADKLAGKAPATQAGEIASIDERVEKGKYGCRLALRVGASGARRGKCTHAGRALAFSPQGRPYTRAARALISQP